MGRAALTNEPIYQGEPILAVCAVDELTAAEAIELIDIDFEPLPFVIDPLETLRPGGPNPRAGRQCLGSANRRALQRPCSRSSNGPRRILMSTTKAVCRWAKRPITGPMETWMRAFKNAALILDETFITPDVSHVCLEPRTAMAYWQNGKLYLHSGTQSTAQTLPAIARWMNMDVDKIVFISEYTGGGFGSKITGGVTMIIPALLSKKLNAPVMMRVSREEETYIGRARPSIQGRMKIGFAKDGRITALDMFTICNNGALRLARRWRSSSGQHRLLAVSAAGDALAGVSVMTNTPTRSAQSAAGRLAGNHHHGTDPLQGGAQARG